MQFKKGPVYEGPFYFCSFRGRIFPLNYYDADSLRTKKRVQVAHAADRGDTNQCDRLLRCQTRKTDTFV